MINIVTTTNDKRKETNWEKSRRIEKRKRRGGEKKNSILTTNWSTEGIDQIINKRVFSSINRKKILLRLSMKNIIMIKRNDRLSLTTRETKDFSCEERFSS